MCQVDEGKRCVKKSAVTLVHTLLPHKTRPLVDKEPPKENAHRFGWCVDGHHTQCRTEYVDQHGKKITCECACHDDC